VNMPAEQFAEIIPFGAMGQALHYRIPAELHSHLQVGKRVLVPLGHREALGLVIKVEHESPPISEKVTLRDILAVVDELPTVPQELIELCRWIADYYFYPLGEVLQSTLPGNIQLKPESHFRIAHTGASAPIPEKPSAVLELLRTESPLSLSEIQGRLQSHAGLPRELKSLVAENWIERFFVWEDPPARPKLVKMVRLCGIDQERLPSQRSEKAHSVVILLEQAGGTLPLKTLRRQVKQADYWISKWQREGLVTVESIEILRQSGWAQNIPESHPPVLTPAQEAVYHAVGPLLRMPAFKPFLVHGVTGSGKTEVYLRLIEAALQHQRGVLVLVPEIALSTQLEGHFRHRLGNTLAIWHSALSPGERYDQWRQALTGKTGVVLGARSAVFMPIQNLGLIIVDEEHDLSYKQEERLRYHARDTALVRAQRLGIPIVLGTATPSLQSLQHALAGRYRMLSLTTRIFERPLPTLEVVDMRLQRGKFRILSGRLKEALQQTVDSGRQAILFLNRRGFATFLLCRSCGEAVSCPHCSVSLTYHRQHDLLRCHYCGYEQRQPGRCPRCDHTRLFHYGFGTERLEHELREFLPKVRLARMDRDVVTHSRELVKILDRVRDHQVDVLIGTQMVTKGHDFPNVTLVGVINADISLQIADFRAGETTVQLLTQVAGRAGRGDSPGHVIIQTYNPHHPAIRCVVDGDYLSFGQQELEARKRLQYPPHTRLVKLLVTDRDAESARLAAHELAELCRKLASEMATRQQSAAVLGPAPAPLWKLKNRYRWHLYVKAWHSKDLLEFVETVFAHAKGSPILKKVQLSVDRDPVSTL
jgi:primosomal protein N' (replication factor Y) (superfamily II helicase)